MNLQTSKGLLPTFGALEYRTRTGDRVVVGGHFMPGSAARRQMGGSMTLVGRYAPVTLLGLVLGVGAAVPARAAQLVVGETETIDFDRPESWGMSYYASLALLTSMGAPQKRAAGRVDLGFEGGHVPQLSDEQRRLGYNGTKLEDVNKTRFFGRVRASVGIGQGFALELGWTPPVEVGGARPNIVAAALGRPFELSPSLLAGVRAFGQVGTITADITCSASEVAAADDVERNPFRCVEPSHDESRQKVVGLELVLGYDGARRFKPYAGVGLKYLDLEFRVNAVYSGGLVEDHGVQLTSGTTVSATAGLTFAANERFRVTAELFYSWLRVARPPSRNSANEGLLNTRVFVSYRLR
jgi:opacity protein-like surface antigen